MVRDAVADLQQDRQENITLANAMRRLSKICSCDSIGRTNPDGTPKHDEGCVTLIATQALKEWEVATIPEPGRTLIAYDEITEVGKEFFFHARRRAREMQIAARENFEPYPFEPIHFPRHMNCPFCYALMTQLPHSTPLLGLWECKNPKCAERGAQMEEHHGQNPNGNLLWIHREIVKAKTETHCRACGNLKEAGICVASHCWYNPNHQFYVPLPEDRYKAPWHLFTGGKPAPSATAPTKHIHSPDCDCADIPTPGPGAVPGQYPDVKTGALCRECGAEIVWNFAGPQAELICSRVRIHNWDNRDLPKNPAQIVSGCRVISELCSFPYCKCSVPSATPGLEAKLRQPYETIPSRMGKVEDVPTPQAKTSCGPNCTAPNCDCVTDIDPVKPSKGGAIPTKEQLRRARIAAGQCPECGDESCTCESPQPGMEAPEPARIERSPELIGDIPDDKLPGPTKPVCPGCQRPLGAGGKCWNKECSH